MESNDKIIYSINIEDVQNVAQEVFGRALNQKELDVIEDNLGDYIPWFDSIEAAISTCLELKNKSITFDEGK